MNIMRVKESPITPVDKAPEPALGTDPIPASRYTSPDYMRKEWDHMWTRVWLLGGLVSDIPEPGDYICTDVGEESVILVRGRDRVIRAFYNVCQHRANQLRAAGTGHADSFKCGYHHWEWTVEGEVRNIPDADDFPQGTPCDKLRLQELKCDTWGGFVWFNMDPEAEPLDDYLGVVPQHLDPYRLDEMACIHDTTTEWACNWKTSVDAFNETYHVQGIHPQLMWVCDDVHVQTDLYERHSRYLVPFASLSPRINLEDPGQIPGAMQEMMLRVGMDPKTYAGDVETLRRDMQVFRRAHGAEQGLDFSRLNDDQLTDDYHYFIFPNITLNIYADRLMLFRQRPHPTDPDRMFFDMMLFAVTPKGQKPQARAPHRDTVHGKDSLGLVVDQDAYNLPRVQRGLHSRGFNKGLWIPYQERRIRHFHRTLEAYVGE
ncbi:MAG: Rieske 2Fe-2S domain-containing protein [Alphaproteobacteria bacterium]|nr:Rieske 2Fe-2S domain-containing protein [Alphaproteobacteria bacterium]